MKRYIIILLTIALAGSMSLGITASNSPVPSLPAKTSKPLKELYTQLLQNINTKSELHTIQLFENKARIERNSFSEAVSYLFYLRFYCYNQQIKKAYFWADQLNNLARKNDYYELLYKGRRFVTELYLINGDYGLALMEAKSMSTEAELLNLAICRITAHQSLAAVYIASGQYEEAKKTLLETTEVPNVDYSLYIRQNNLILLIRTYLEIGQLDKVRTYLEQFFQILGPDLESLTDNSAENRKFPEAWFKYHYYYATYCMKIKDMQEAEKQLNILKKITNETTYICYQILYHKIHGDFYASQNQYTQALTEWNEVLKHVESNSGDYRKALQRIAETLQLTGNDQEAYNSYLQLVQLQDTVEQNRYIRQISQFRTSHQAEQNEIINEQLRLKTHYLYFLILALSLLCLSLVLSILINRHLKKKLQKAKEKAERSDLLKSAFLANMNHEIRTPLNAIAGFSQLLADETDPDIAQQYIGIINTNNQMLVNLLNDVLDISKIESDNISFSYSKVHLPAVINELYDMTQLHIPASVEFIKESMPDLTIDTDKNRLIQILSNLLSNAIKHTEKGQIRFGYSLNTPETVRFYVTDTGKGISDELQKKLFNRFVQAVETHSKGVGLGLALCKGFVNQMEGEIGVESIEGEGSTFWFTLPYNK